ncbi:uncharacterized protein UHOD_03476 [Ustilago sp. UG-2017b]|nr:uncharacterized protein UHOD_03476 [Ustilago sp. UG-2017b]
MSLQAEPAQSAHPHPFADDNEPYEQQQRREALWNPEQHGGVPSKAHRHIHIDWPNASIKKTIAIGASAPEASPPVYDRPRHEDETANASSCVLITKSSPINATVHILREKRPESASAPDSKPVLISAKTGSLGSISLSIPSYSGARPLDIRAKSYNGNITVFLPTSFAGMLKWNSETGTLKVSPAMQQRFKLLDPQPHKHRGTAKIASSIASGMRGDVCTISNHHGSITIKEFGEGEGKASSGDGGKSCVIQ